MTPDDAIEQDRRHMGRAMELARRGEGYVEPNPMVGCVLVRNGEVVGEGWHQKFGGPHAEVEALAAAGSAAKGATAYVTLEPCSHTGKTPPCTEALIRAGVERVVVGCRDPNPHVSGEGVAQLEAAGVKCHPSVLADEAADVIAPFTKLVTTGRPWVIAKWAMTLDGKFATHTGDSRWISGEQSRAKVHQLRGRVDAIVVGAGTVKQDDPLLTARPPGPRTPTRIILDSQASLPLASQLVATAHETPVLLATSSTASPERLQALRERGVEVWQTDEIDSTKRWNALLDELGRRQMTNVLVEGGAKVLGALFDAGAIDEVHVFIAPKLVGGAGPGPVAGRGLPEMNLASRLIRYTIEQLGGDAYIHGRFK
jgi:diaminohydroxyphosphoribosylaminopyrimidine deaminase / 5-amino-6-(5-phosphoribosylamino)uracil reductase